MKFLKSIFHFFSSVKLAVIVLLSLAYVLALGTIYESLYGAAVAKEKVYGTLWFTFVLTFLGINVLCAALSRLPWKRHHLGFVITHAGILVILAGSLITQRFGLDGSLAIAQGDRDDRITLDDPLLQVSEPDHNSVQTWKARYSQDDPPSEKHPWTRRLKDGGLFKVDQFYPHAQASLSVTSAPEGSTSALPALRVALSGIPAAPDQEISEWLFLKNSAFGPSTVSLGPAKISFMEEKILESLSSTVESNSTPLGRLSFEWEGKKAEVDVQEPLEKEFPVPGTPFKIQVLRYLPDARVVKGRLESRSNEPLNPALEFKIQSPDWQETHLVFAQFPDLEGVHGRGKGEAKVKARFTAANAAGRPGMGLRGELLLALKDEKTVLYRVRTKGVLSGTKRISVGEETPTGWMTLRFKVAEAYPSAIGSFQYRKVMLPAGKSGPPPAIHFKIEREGQRIEDWIEQGDMKEMALGGVPYLIRYGLRAHPLGFQLNLKRFEVGKYAGTNSPSSFESYVQIKNDKTGEDFETKIHMNHPLKYEGYTFFQSSYQEPSSPQDPPISIFSVARDPGTPVKYAGAILMVGGISLMFWFKPLFVQKRMEARQREKAALLANGGKSVPCETA